MFKVCLCDCWQVQHLGARGQHFGPSPGPSLRGEVSWNLFRERQWDLTFFFFFSLSFCSSLCFCLCLGDISSQQKIRALAYRKKGLRPRSLVLRVMSSWHRHILLHYFKVMAVLHLHPRCVSGNFQIRCQAANALSSPQNDFLFSRTEHCRIFS